MVRNKYTTNILIYRVYPILHIPYTYLILQHGHECVHVYAEGVGQAVVVRDRATD